VDLRTVLEEYAAKQRGKPKQPDSDRHLFLVLDKHVQGLPWESIPSLRGRPVSRIPSLSFLIDRIELARLQQPGGPASPPDRINIDPLKTFFVLNPSGDLATTQKTYEEGFKSLEASGWSGVVGRAPSEGEMVQGLQGNDLVL
jgi:separase